MKREIGIRLILTVLFLLIPATQSGAQSELQPSSVPGIMVQQGFDAEIFALDLNLPVQLALESDGSILVMVASNCGYCPVVRLSQSGNVIAQSNPIQDPDGVAVDSLGQVYVAGGSNITIAGSLDGGTDEIFATSFWNLNNIAIDSNDRIVVVQDNGDIYEVTAAGIKVEPPLASFGVNGNALAFDKTDRLFAGRYDLNSGPGELYRIDVPGSPTLISSEVNPMAIAVGQGGVFESKVYVAEYYEGTVQRVDETTGAATLFASGLDKPHGLVFDSTDALLVSEMDLGRIIRIFHTQIQVQIDIKPGSYPNSINLGSGGTAPVAILSTNDFDATTVEPVSVTLASAPVKLKGKGTPMASFEDVNADGLLDQVVHVETQAFELSETDEEAILEAETSNGIRIRGLDSVRVVP